MFCIALVWAYLVGEHKDVSVKPIETLKHGRKARKPLYLEKIIGFLLHIHFSSLPLQ